MHCSHLAALLSLNLLDLFTLLLLIIILVAVLSSTLHTRQILFLLQLYIIFLYLLDNNLTVLELNIFKCVILLLLLNLLLLQLHILSEVELLPIEIVFQQQVVINTPNLLLLDFCLHQVIIFFFGHNFLLPSLLLGVQLLCHIIHRFSVRMLNLILILLGALIYTFDVPDEFEVFHGERFLHITRPVGSNETHHKPLHGDDVLLTPHHIQFKEIVHGLPQPHKLRHLILLMRLGQVLEVVDHRLIDLVVLLPHHQHDQ